MFEWLDSSLFSALNRGAANPALDWLMPRITNLHQKSAFWIAVAVAAAFVVLKGSRRAKIWFLCAIVAVGISDLGATRIAKRLIGRSRPCAVMPGSVATVFPDDRLVPGTHCPGSHSFPSNHASNMMALGAVGWWFTRRKWGRWLWFLVPLVIGYSRIYLGYHYPTDVLGGWILGALIAAVVIALGRRWVQAESERLHELDDAGTIEQPDV